MKARMHELIERVVDGIDGTDKAVIVTDVNGLILSWNRGAEELYGWPSDLVLGRHILGVTPARLTIGDGARIMSSLQAGIPWRGNFVVRTRTREEITVDVDDTPVRGERGDVIGIVGVSHRALAAAP
ncbi:MAG: PAS domain S-box protein [Gemmatimonadetes bacterium]|nr:PAS domain S-box protein [Gemmatimonadota bacterium]